MIHQLSTFFDKDKGLNPGTLIPQILASRYAFFSVFAYFYASIYFDCDFLPLMVTWAYERYMTDI
jgi:hypothetical protein